MTDTLDCPPSGEVKNENVLITLSCDTYYYGYKNPVLGWFTQDGKIAGNMSVSDNRVV